MVDNNEFNRLIGCAVTARIRDLSEELIHWITELERLERSPDEFAEAEVKMLAPEGDEPASLDEIFTLLESGRH